MTSRRILAGLAAAIVVVVGLLALAADGTVTAEATLLEGPTAAAEQRTLQTTITETGTLERVDTRTITYSGDLARRAASSEAPATTGSATTDQAPVTADASTSGATTTGGAGAPTNAATAPADAAAAPTSTTIPAEVTQADADPEPITLTGIAEVGTPVARGTVLYSADDEPVVALLGSVPHWRQITYGIADGEDIRQLEENLAALGYGEEMTVDGAYTNATASAIAAWEADIGRASPDVIVEVGDIVFLQSEAIALSQELSVGDELDPGTPVLVIGTAQQVVAGDVAADQTSIWAAGTEGDLEWSDGSHATGTVFATGRDVTDDQVDLLVTIAEADSARLTGSEVRLTAIDEARADALAVPVSAIIDGPNGKASVRVPNGTDADQLRPVTLGLVAGGWVEITEGLDAGTEVRLPG